MLEFKKSDGQPVKKCLHVKNITNGTWDTFIELANAIMLVHPVVLEKKRFPALINKFFLTIF